MTVSMNCRRIVFGPGIVAVALKVHVTLRARKKAAFAPATATTRFHDPTRLRFQFHSCWN